MGCADSVDEELIEEAKAEQKAKELEKQRKIEKEMRRMQADDSGTGTYNITATPGTEQNRSTIKKKSRRRTDELLPGELDTIGEDDEDILALQSGKKSKSRMLTDGNSDDLDDATVNSKCRCIIIGFEKVITISKLQKTDTDLFEREVLRLLEATLMMSGGRGGPGASSLSSSLGSGDGPTSEADIIGGGSSSPSITGKRGYTIGDLSDDFLPLPRTLSPPSMDKAYSMDSGLATAVTTQTASDTAVLSEELTGSFTRYLGGKSRIKKLCQLFRYLRCECQIRIYIVCDTLKSQTLRTLFNSVGLIDIDTVHSRSVISKNGINGIDNPSSMLRGGTDPTGAKGTDELEQKLTEGMDHAGSKEEEEQSPLMSDDLIGSDSILFGDGLKKNSVVFNVIKKDGLNVDDLLYIDWDASVVKYFHSIGLCRTMRITDRHGLANPTVKKLTAMFELKCKEIKDASSIGVSE